MRHLELVSTCADQTRALAAAMASAFQAGDFIGLTGDLGAGKTCFIQGLCAGLGVSAGVRSPTFVLLHHYPTRQPSLLVHHFDLYRLEQARELDDLGYEEFFWGDGICVVEWADRFPDLLPETRLDIRLSYGSGPDTRHLHLEAHGARYESLLDGVAPTSTRA